VKQQRPTRRRNVKLEPPPAWRARAVLIGFAVFGVVLAGRAFDLQVVEHEFLAQEGEKRHLRTVEVPAVRGAIRDRNGEPLALSAPTESVWAVPSALLEAPEKLGPLARVLDMKTDDLRERLRAHASRQFLYLRRQLSPAEGRMVMAVEAPGVFLQREYKRYYPAGEAAAQLVGLTNIDGAGQEGLELALQARLDGQPGSRRVIKDRLGRVVDDIAEFAPPRAGQDIRLTVDLRLQYAAYRELKAAVERNRASSGMVVMVEPSSGDVLAMASYPSFNPNNRDALDPSGLRHRAVTDTFEPGSTIKPLIMARALDEGRIGPGSVIDTEGGVWRVSRDLTVRDFRDYGDVDLKRLLTKSSNVGAAKIGLELGPESVWQAYLDFGFGAETASGFPGERTGVLRDFYNWGRVETATAAYGYGVAVTGLQLAGAYAALANDGLAQSLKLVREQTQVLGSEPRQVVTPQAARTVRQKMSGVVSNEGTASRAALPGYSVAGKTGTVRKVGGSGYNRERHQSLFVGMTPLDNPRVVTVVVIDEPRGKDYYGGAVAAPVFARVMRDALRVMKVRPDQGGTLTADAAAADGERS